MSAENQTWSGQREGEAPVRGSGEDPEPRGSSGQNPASRLGAVLLTRGVINQKQLEVALAEQRRRRVSLARAIVDLGFATEAQLLAALAEEAGYEFVDLSTYPVDAHAAGLVPEQMCRRYNLIPIKVEDGTLVVAMADPSDVIALDDVRAATGMMVRPVVASRQEIAGTISRFHRAERGAEEAAEEAAEEFGAEEEVGRLKEATQDAPIVRFVNLLIAQAVKDRASDIHIEPQEKDLRVRFRVDGVLHEVMRSPRGIHPGVVSRIKIMSDMDIAERRVPQDGRVSMVVEGKPVDLRVATLPGVYGEKVVIRILDKSSVLLRLEDLGFLPDSLAAYERSFRKPYGMILVTGPTGSGKSTTLYATLNILNTPDKNIITVEDPVEYRLPGVNQIQVNPKAGLTFASALRSILRSDPDIILIGEIRDRETAIIAVEAALTGHLVLSTLHTNDAPSAVTRLVEMGLEPFLVVSALDCVLAQRLARRLCTRCKEPYQPSLESLREVGFSLEPDEPPPTLYRPRGCVACSNTGYRGRMAVNEVMVMTEEIERLVVENRSSEEIRRTAMAQGMRTLRQDGLLKAKMGLTSLEEVLRVTV